MMGKVKNELLDNWESDKLAFLLDKNEFIVLNNILMLAAKIFASSQSDCFRTNDLKRADYFNTLAEQTDYILNALHKVAKSGYDGKTKALH